MNRINAIMNDKPLVSILSPCYNVEKFLPKCLDTIINQTYNNLQIVLINDGSKDSTWNIMQAYAAKDKRIEIYQQNNCGVATTRNRLLDKAKGHYFLFIDSDDWIELDMVEFLVNKSIMTNASIITCGIVKNDNFFNKESIKEEIWEQPKVILEFLRHVYFNGSLGNKLIRTDLLHNVKFHPEISYGEDALFTWNILQNVNKVVITDKTLYHYRMNETSLSHSSWTPDRKGSNHLVWEQITKDTKKQWPQFLHIVKTRAALEDMWSLYYASNSSYQYDENIKIRQQNIRKNLLLILRSDMASCNMKVYACLASLSYKLLKYIKRT